MQSKKKITSHFISQSTICWSTKRLFEQCTELASLLSCLSRKCAMHGERISHHHMGMKR